MLEQLKIIPTLLSTVGSFFNGDFSVEKIFWLVAIFGTGLFITRAFLLILGFGDDSISDADASVGGDIDADSGLHIFSLTTITSFLMMFGWSGLAACKGFQLSEPLSILIAFFVGLVSMLVIASVMRFIFSLGDPGDTFKAEEAVGTVAEVFEKIPQNGKGMVFVMIKGGRREFSATSADGEEIPSFTKVTITKLIAIDAVIVKRVE